MELEIRNISKHYKDKKAVDDVSLTLTPESYPEEPKLEDLYLWLFPQESGLDRGNREEAIR